MKPNIYPDNRITLLKLSAFLPFGPATLNKFINKFPDLNDVFRLDINKLLLQGIGRESAQSFLIWKENFCLENLLKSLKDNNIDFLTLFDDEYPNSLRCISSPPAILYYKGDISLLNNGGYFLSIVGTRNNSTYAERVIQNFVPELINNNFKIISGLAYGVDCLAHEETLKQGGKTIAVLGSGLSEKVLYPNKNINLANKIISSGGLIISEYLPNAAALKINFPRRNRIISGLSQSVLIVEAEKKSGSLITAKYAVDQNRDVLVIPGSIFSKTSVGTNELIKNGCIPINSIEDILKNFDIVSKSPQLKNMRKCSLDLNGIELEIYTIIRDFNMSNNKIGIDDLVNILKLDTSTINSTLSILEIKGLIKNLGASFESNF